MMTRSAGRPTTTSRGGDGVDELCNHAYGLRLAMLHILIGLMNWLGMVAATKPKTIQKAVQIADTLTDEALSNGSIKKNPEKRGNGGEPSKDSNVRDDNKSTRTGNVFATTANPVRGKPRFPGRLSPTRREIDGYVIGLTLGCLNNKVIMGFLKLWEINAI
ncbi:hypothetical protein Tco_0739478 [Tanacetum coccineum]